MDLENIMLNEKSQSQKEILYNCTYAKYLEESDSQRQSGLEVTRGWGEGSGELLLKRYGISFWGDEKFGNTGDGCTTL